MQCIDKCKNSVTILQTPYIFVSVHFLLFPFSLLHSTTELIFFFIIKEVQVHEFRPWPPSWLWASYITLRNLIVCIFTHWVTKCHPNLHAKKYNIWPKIDPEFWWWKMPSNCLLLWFINLALNKNATVPTSIYILSIITSLACFSRPDLTFKCHRKWQTNIFSLYSNLMWSDLLEQTRTLELSSRFIRIFFFFKPWLR